MAVSRGLLQAIVMYTTGVAGLTLVAIFLFVTVPFVATGMLFVG